MFRLALSAAALLLPVGGIQAADPLDFIPEPARVIVCVDHPRKVAEVITSLQAFKQAQTLPQVNELYDSPTARQLLKLLAFAEKELDSQWPELLDQVAGNGAAVGFVLGNDAPAVGVLAGKHPKQVQRAFDLLTSTLEAEYSRQGAKEKLKLERKDDTVIAHLGDDVHFALIQSTTILVSNKAEFLQLAIAQSRKPAAERGPTGKCRAEAFKILPKGPLAWLWVNFGAVKESKEAKDFFENASKDTFLTLGAGSTIDCLKRADFVALGLYQEAEGFRLRLRLPAGREGLSSHLAVHVPPKGPASLPLLEPPGTLYTQSFHLDLAYMWKNRDQLITGDIRKQFDKAEKELGRFLPDVKLGEFLEAWGPYHRVVIANHDKRPYKKEPATKLPAFAYVTSIRDRKLGESFESLVRGAAVIGALQFGLKSSEIEFEGVTLTTFRFSETKEVEADPQGVRFNFEPCYAIIGNELLIASTVELGKKMVLELKKPRGAASVDLWRAKFSASKGAEVLAGEPDILITDAVLSRGVGLQEARSEVASLVEWIKTLGTVRIELGMTSSEYQLDFIWSPGK